MALRIELDGNGHARCSGIRLGEPEVLRLVAEKLRGCGYGSDEHLTPEGAFYSATEAVARAIEESLRELTVMSFEE